jgi:hypothetical protein
VLVNLSFEHSTSVFKHLLAKQSREKKRKKEKSEVSESFESATGEGDFPRGGEEECRI